MSTGDNKYKLNPPSIAHQSESRITAPHSHYSTRLPCTGPRGHPLRPPPVPVPVPARPGPALLLSPVPVLLRRRPTSPRNVGGDRTPTPPPPCARAPLPAIDPQGGHTTPAPGTQLGASMAHAALAKANALQAGKFQVVRQFRTGIKLEFGQRYKAVLCSMKVIRRKFIRVSEFMKW